MVLDPGNLTAGSGGQGHFVAQTLRFQEGEMVAKAISAGSTLRATGPLGPPGARLDLWQGVLSRKLGVHSFLCSGRIAWQVPSRQCCSSVTPRSSTLGVTSLPVLGHFHLPSWGLPAEKDAWLSDGKELPCTTRGSLPGTTWG